ncbi:MAG: primosomal protein N' [Flavonifractor plautii]|uniref:Replication restart protein PriA n=1 Tax=Flavonifractor plautii TaxID=292800 RepID=A0AAW6CDF0_FLAPL|nr:primosomal protein N' [Flavonifractor plautii]MDB7897916.1 primosomal protein N' [Flavonifractor plautii]MDB7926650.1 primosomal protein N' [Flavonifractor plautii]MDB7932601.1 primosomal protein N' [Flavonifractor plautii]MDB7936677.1 primosomal protein N' [Flavonifractor plautii]MDU3779746.1 primosomal protein N' [Flavonifractor plautii]
MEGNTVAKIALQAATYAIDKPYDYQVPLELLDTLRPGMRVVVPFGAGNRRTEGIVLALEGGYPDDPRRKSILTVLDEEPVLDGEALRLALWMRERWFCTVYDAARAMLPAGLYFSLQDRWKLAPGVEREAAYAAAGRSEHARHIVELLFVSGREADVAQIKEAFGTKDPNPALKLLRDKGILTLETSASRGVGDKKELVASLAIPPEEAMALVTPRRRSAPLRYAVTELLCAIGSASAKELCYFTGAANATLRSLEKSGILRLEHREVFRRVTVEAGERAAPPVLNAEQQAAFEGLDALAAAGRPAAALLYGVTGSGKTQVYLRLIYEALARGRTAMVLVPEIALTPQLLRIFASHFGDDIAVLHSSLRAGERYDEWKRVRSGQARVVIGTRSAVFAPLRNLGLLILDEEQESTYKSENVPKYHARDVAKYRCAQNDALLVLGSATPSVESMYHAKRGDYRLFTLRRRYNEQALPEVLIADMKKELRAGNGTSLSGPLRAGLAAAMEAGEQSILFLNRRGASRMVTCGECGEVPTCPRCSVHLTYHSANGRLMCHYCGHSEPLPDACPSCGGALNFLGYGTQKVEEELHAAFPGREILRMDTDTVSATQSHEKLLSRFEKERIPVLVGTQMVAKGLDFENVTLVGVISADLSLYVDDYRAGERTFSLLTQVVGRAGRGAKQGRAVIQTFTPENDVIRCAARQDYDSFYEQEIELRRMRLCPPFRELFVLTASGPLESAVLRTCMRLRRSLEGWLAQPPFRDWELTVLGPAPASVAKINDRYRYRLTLAAQNTKEIRAMVAHLVRCAQTDKENKGVSVSADVNPLD